MPQDLTHRLAGHLKSLRLSRNWSLDQLAAQSGVSRATLSRLEKAEVSPTTTVLGKLCTAFDLSMSRLLMMVEEGFTAHLPFADQPEWTDPDTGYSRRSVSPPAAPLAAEILECHLPPGSDLAYDKPAREGQEHHLVVMDGALTLTIDGTAHHLTAGDCLRYRLSGASRFVTDPGRGARYMLVLV